MSVPHILKNSNYTNKYIVDADKLNENFEYILNQVDGSPLKNLIMSSGQQYSKLNANQIITAIVQFVLGGQYFIDEGTVNEIVLVPSVSSYSVPAVLVDKMEFLFKPAISNSGPVTMIFKGFESTSGTKPLLDKLGNELTSGALLANTVYPVHYDASINGGSFLLGSLRASSSNNGSADPSAELEYFVETLGIPFSETSTSQLARAVSEYSLLSAYIDVSESSDISSGIYRIKPFGSIALPFNVHNGMTIRFTPQNDGGTSIVIDGITSSAIPIKNMSGEAISVNEITRGIDIVVRYRDTNFYLVSNRQSTLSLSSGPSVKTIEGTLTNTATAIPTSYATYNAISEVSTNLETVSNNLSALSSKVDSMPSNLSYKPFSVLAGPNGSNDQTYIYYDPSNTSTTILTGTTLRYADGSFETISNLTSNVADLRYVTGSFKILFIQNSGLAVVESTNYTESYTAPSTAGSDGDAYTYIDTYGRIKTYIYSTEEASWVETNFIKVAFGEESSGTISFHVPPLCGKYNSMGLAVPDFSTNSLIVSHNMDSACRVQIQLECITADLDYTIGDKICLTPFYTSSEYFSVGNTPTTTVINSTGILLPATGTNPTAAITPSNWKFNIYIERAF